MTYIHPNRIVVTGPESTGKTAAVMHIASAFGVQYSLEFARTYLERLERKYTYEDLVPIARGQAAWIDTASLEASKRGDQWVVADTDLLTIYLWSLIKFGKVDSYVVEILDRQRADFYLLMYSDIPWEPDPLREDPGTRKAIFKRYLKEIKKRNIPHKIIRGTGRERTLSVEKAMMEILH